MSHRIFSPVFLLATVCGLGSVVFSSCRITPGRLAEEDAEGGAGGERPVTSNPANESGGQEGPQVTGGAASQSCQDSEIQCVTQTSYQKCQSDGQWGPPSDCPYLCAGNSCVGSCRPDDAECRDLRRLATCSENGEWEIETCQYACVEDRCAGECVPGTRRCLDPDGREVQEGVATQLCNKQGKWGATQGCLEGCRSTVCEGRCQDGVEALCVVEGESYEAASCEQNTWTRTSCEYICAAGACTGKCKPGAGQCNEDGEPQQCDENGEWVSQGQCVGGQLCVEDGRCLAPPTISNFSSDKDQGIVRTGEEVRLQWSLSGGEVESITLEPDSGKQLDSSVRSTSFIPERTAVYTLSVENAAGSSTKQLTLRLAPQGELYSLDDLSGAPTDLATSASGRVVAALTASATYTVGPITVSRGEDYLAEIDLKEGSVLRIQRPEYAPSIWDIAFDNEDLIIAGDDDSGQVAVERLDPELQTNDHVVYSVGPGSLQFAFQVFPRPDRKIWVAGYSSSHLYGSLVELDEDLQPQRDDGAVVGYVTAGGAHWGAGDETLAVSPEGVIGGLRTDHGQQWVFDRVLGFPQVQDVISPLWDPQGEYTPSTQGVAAFPEGDFSGDFVAIGNDPYGVSAHFALIKAPSTVLHGAPYAPSNISVGDYDRVEWTDVCINDASEMILAGWVEKNEERDFFVHSLTRTGDAWSEGWDAPFIWGKAEVNEMAREVVCDPRGYILVLGTRRDLSTAEDGDSFLDNDSFLATLK